VLVRVFGVRLRDDRVFGNAELLKQLGHVFRRRAHPEPGGRYVSGADDSRGLALPIQMGPVQDAIPGLGDFDSRPVGYPAHYAAAEDENAIGLRDRVWRQVAPLQVPGEAAHQPAMAAHEQDCHRQHIANPAHDLELAEQSRRRKKQKAKRGRLGQFQEQAVNEWKHGRSAVIGER